MTDTAKLSLPLLSPSQAQKHVTVNEALSRLDAAVQLTVQTRSVATPPSAADEGASYIVPSGAVNEWSGEEGRIAVRQNGGWIFLQPFAGWRAYVVDEVESVQHDGMDWVAGVVGLSQGGAAFAMRVHEFDHTPSAGASSLTGLELPANAVVFGLTGRILSDLTGSLASWRLGVPGSDDRYGSGLGTAAGSWLRGLTGTPLTYYAPTELLLTAEGGTFDGGGAVRIAVHYCTLGLPRMV